MLQNLGFHYFLRGISIFVHLLLLIFHFILFVGKIGLLRAEMEPFSVNLVLLFWVVELLDS